jgi:hypothetical protein
VLSTFIMYAILLSTPASPAPQLQKPQDLQTKLHSRIESYALDANDFARALLAIADKFNLPMGVEWVTTAGTMQKVNLSWNNATVQQILDTVVKAQPGYSLEISGDVIHIFPEERNTGPKNFLSLKIDKFEVHNEVIEIANRKLHTVLKAKISPPITSPKGPIGIVSSQGMNIGDPEFSLALQNVTVRDILDNLARASDRKIWVVTFIESPPKLTAYRQTTTLWTHKEIPEVEQPVWDILRWTDPIP